jgi:2-polyprenyl-3-methyl-5-hydroxy-6-metoxy-1,4-benzoquinol methylase
MSPVYGRFLRHVPASGRILDAGCGVGRDALAFAEHGFVMGFDASAEMVRMARERVGDLAEIRQMRSEEVAWREEFDGVWACASLLHVPVAASKRCCAPGDRASAGSGPPRALQAWRRRACRAKPPVH